MVKRHYGFVPEEYKMVYLYFDLDKWELYDRKKDPQEMNNVYHNPAYAEAAKELMVKLEELRKKYKDSKELDE